MLKINHDSKTDVSQKAKVLPFPITAKREPLTADKLRGFPGCEHYSDEEAGEIVATIKVFAKIVHAASAHGTHYDNREQGSIHISKQNNLAQKLAA